MRVIFFYPKKLKQLSVPIFAPLNELNLSNCFCMNIKKKIKQLFQLRPSSNYINFNTKGILMLVFFFFYAFISKNILNNN